MDDDLYDMDISQFVTAEQKRELDRGIPAYIENLRLRGIALGLLPPDFTFTPDKRDLH